MPSSVRQIVMAVGALGWTGSCANGGDDPIERACRVIVEDCGRGAAVGDCVDALLGEPWECLDCIVASGCEFERQCSQGAVRCYFPDAYVTLERADGGSLLDARPRREASPSDGGTDAPED